MGEDEIYLLDSSHHPHQWLLYVAAQVEKGSEFQPLFFQKRKKTLHIWKTTTFIESNNLIQHQVMLL
jgi:hypothetical protein